MMTRSTQATLTFKKPFVLSAIGERLPAGAYKVVVDEEAIPGLSFLAFRRTATQLHTPAVALPDGASQMLVVDGDELAAAFKADRSDGANAPSTKGAGK